MTSPVKGNGRMLITIAFGVLVSGDIHRTTIATCRSLVLRHGGNIFHLTRTPMPRVSPPGYTYLSFYELQNHKSDAGCVLMTGVPNKLDHYDVTGKLP